MIHDTCDYCFRPFGWTDKAICTNCGLENVRSAVIATQPVRETAMMAPAAEKAIKPPVSVPQQKGHPKLIKKALRRK